MKDTVFISHAYPQDNYAAFWLASKLAMLGYKVWVDVENLSAGDAFNTEIGPVIKNEAKVFLALTTESYSEKSNNPNSGVSRELNASDTINIHDLGHNFVLPLKFDAVSYTNFPYHYQGKNAIEFNGNWQRGLIDLVKDLQRLNVPCNEKSINTLKLWHEGLSLQSEPIRRLESYYSNWFPFTLPDKIYIYTPHKFVKEDLYDKDYPYITESDRIISFAAEETIAAWTAIDRTYSFPIHFFYSEMDLQIDEDFTLKDPKKKLIKLLNVAFQLHLRRQNLICWNRGRNSKVFYFRSDKVPASISLRRYGKMRGRRSLCGQVNPKINEQPIKANWSFSIEMQANLEPYPHVRVSPSAVFSNANFRRFDDQTHHALRRNVCSTWYNREWYEKLLAAMLAISPTINNQWIEVTIDAGKFIELDNEPFNATSSVGYKEPNDDNDN